MTAPDQGASEFDAGRRLFAGPCDFVAGAASPASLPAATAPEIAFAGRSNVGKSSLINALTGRKSLARVSRTPGRTQQINFFSLGGRLALADLPGYGFARAPKKRIAQWSDLIYRYLKGRSVLRRVLILVDSRHGLKDSDRALFDFLDEAAVSYQVVLTKIDALRGDDALARARAVASELAGHVAAYPDVSTTSAETGIGIPELRAALAAFAA
ncbi:MAG TPA: ribosome biogenesis GTP-binding protein YihA/YsxC [Alphaproteobacteria bacterium]|nr:ribosome biogenesis GTP-binding protein YihA/YsxC [Alphaproteobacteria bacterium]